MSTANRIRDINDINDIIGRLRRQQNPAQVTVIVSSVENSEGDDIDPIRLEVCFGVVEIYEALIEAAYKSKTFRLECARKEYIELGAILEREGF